MMALFTCMIFACLAVSTVIAFRCMWRGLFTHSHELRVFSWTVLPSVVVLGWAVFSWFCTVTR